MKKFISNRKGQKISVVIEESERGLVFVMHGLGGFKEQKQIETFSDVFREKGFTTVRFDTTNSFGESDGKYEDATLTNYYEDLEDVIDWAKNQSWYEEPFYLIGHSLGGICVSLFAEKYPEKVKALIPVSPVVSGELSISVNPKEKLDEWKRTGWNSEESKSIPGLIKKLKWTHMEDRLKYDLLKEVDKLTMPVLIIVGEKDVLTPVEHQKIFYEKISGEKELHIIKNAPHSFREETYLQQIKNIIKSWIDSVN